MAVLVYLPGRCTAMTFDDINYLCINNYRACSLTWCLLCAFSISGLFVADCRNRRWWMSDSCLLSLVFVSSN